MNTLPKSEKTNLLFCIGALMASENEESVKGPKSSLFDATLRVIEARAKVKATPVKNSFGRRTGAMAPWVRG